jgi:hypothetical protein
MRPLIGALFALGVFVFSAASFAASGRGSSSSAASGKDDADGYGWYVPDYGKLQTGGFVGLLNVGIGYSAFGDVVNVGGAYGYAPAAEREPPYHMVTGTVSIRPIRFRLGSDMDVLPLYCGGGVLGVFGDNLFFRQPAKYPADYYAPTGLHALAFVGIEAGMGSSSKAFIERHALFVEAVTINQYLDAFVQNLSMLLFDAFSLALGYRVSI